MFDIFKLAYLEYKKIFSKKSMYICLGIIFIFAMMSVNQMVKSVPDNINIAVVPLINTMFVGIMQFIIIFQSVSIFTDELHLGTTSFLFSNVKSRAEILLSKVLAMILFCFTASFLNYILVEYYQINRGLQISTSYLILLMGLYFVYAWFMSNFFLFIAVIFKSRSVSFVIGLFFIYLLSDTTRILSEKISISKKFLDYIPFSNVLTFLIRESINSCQITGMIAGGLLFFIATVFIFEKQDLS